jgi:FG-GAP-like repeat/Bacterial pre-peptidase C-terminal domain
MVFDSLNSAKQSDFGSSIRSEVGAVSSFDKSDFYRFEVKSNSGAFLSLSGLSADASLTLMDATGKSISASNRAGTAAEAININLVAGTYYISVGQVSGNTTYKLNLSSNGAFANINENINWLSGDWNGDGFEDVLRQEQGALVDGVSDVQFFLGTSNGGFQVAVNIANMAWMHGNGVNLIAGDFNGDGKTDLVRQEKGAWVDQKSDVQILTFQNGNFQVAADFSIEPGVVRYWQVGEIDLGRLNGNQVNLFAGDFNADGRTDLLYQSKQASSSNTDIILNDGGWQFARTYSSPELLAGDNATFVASGTDLMRLETGNRVDGVNDVQFASSRELSLLRNYRRLEGQIDPVLMVSQPSPNNQPPLLPSPFFWSNTPTANFTLAIAPKPWEAAMTKAYTDNQAVLGQFVRNQATNISPYGTTGRYSAYSSGGSIHWSARTGAIVITSEMEKIYGQVGGSGSWLGMPMGNQYAWQGGTRQNFEGGYLFQNQSVASAFRPNELPVANNDFTGDGKADILWRNTSTGENLFWKMDGTNLSALASTIAVTDKGFKIVGMADFDRDGQNDILWHHSKTGEVVIARMNGTNLVEYRTVDKVADLNWQIAGAADFDKDCVAQ